MERKVIAQVNEETKNLMNQITEDISSSIENGIEDIKSNSRSVRDNVEEILRKFGRLDTIGSSAEELKKISEEVKPIPTMVSDAISAMKRSTEDGTEIIKKQQDTLNQLENGVEKLKESLAESTNELKNKIETFVPELGKESAEVKDVLSSVIKKQEENQRDIVALISETQKGIGKVSSDLMLLQKDLVSKFDVVKSLLETAVGEQKSFIELYAQKEQEHAEFEMVARNAMTATADSMQKLQMTLDLVLKYVTPIWGK